MDHYDAKSALDELKEDAVLTHPVPLRDMILRTQLNAGDALEMNREFQNYLSHYGETQKVALGILEKIAASVPEHSKLAATAAHAGRVRLEPATTPSNPAAT